jgi:hypothetical protein
MGSPYSGLNAGSITIRANSGINIGTVLASATILKVGAAGRTTTFKSGSSATWTNAPATSVLSFNGGITPGTISAGGTISSIALDVSSSAGGPMGPFLSPPSSTWSTTSGLTKRGVGTLTLTPAADTGTLGTLNSSGGILSFGGGSGGVLNVSGSGLLTTSGTLRLLRTTPVTFVNLANGGTMDASGLTPGSFFVQNFNPGNGNSGVVGTPFAQISGVVGDTTSIGGSYTSVPTVTLVGNSTGGGTITAVPEPSGLVLGGLAAATFLLAGRTRRQRAAT